MRVVVVGGGTAGLAAARRLEALLGGRLGRARREGRQARWEGPHRANRRASSSRGAPDSFLSRKERGVGLCEELGLGDELVGRRPENARSFRAAGGRASPAAGGDHRDDPDGPACAGGRASCFPKRAAHDSRRSPRFRRSFGDEDESVASFVSRRLGREAYEGVRGAAHDRDLRGRRRTALPRGDLPQPACSRARARQLAAWAVSATGIRKRLPAVRGRSQPDGQGW